MVSRWGGLVRFAYGLTGDRGHAEDLAQTALAKAFASWPKVRRAQDPDAYVRRILINTNNHRFRKRRVVEVRLTDGKGHFSGAVDGKEWSDDFDNTNCYNILWHTLNGTVLMGNGIASGGATTVLNSGYDLVGSNVDRMELDFSDGTKSPVVIKSLGGYRFYAYSVPPDSVPKGKTLTKVTSFDSAGKPLPVQKGAPVTVGEQKWPSPDTTR